jgi:hypothetical protein
MACHEPKNHDDRSGKAAAPFFAIGILIAAATRADLLPGQPGSSQTKDGQDRCPTSESGSEAMSVFGSIMSAIFGQPAAAQAAPGAASATAPQPT